MPMNLAINKLIEFQPELPVDVRKMIVESLSWVDASDTRLILLAARMENLYFSGKLAGTLEASDRVLAAIESVFGPVQP